MRAIRAGAAFFTWTSFSHLLNLLMDVRREFNLTYVFISHNLAVVEHIATQVAVMYLGQVVEQADTERLFRAPRHPATRALLDAARAGGGES